jgi:hypothetical protein
MSAAEAEERKKGPNIAARNRDVKAAEAATEEARKKFLAYAVRKAPENLRKITIDGKTFEFYGKWKEEDDDRDYVMITVDGVEHSIYRSNSDNGFWRHCNDSGSGEGLLYKGKDYVMTTLIDFRLQKAANSVFDSLAAIQEWCDGISNKNQNYPRAEGVAESIEPFATFATTIQCGKTENFTDEQISEALVGLMAKVKSAYDFGNYETVDPNLSFTRTIDALTWTLNSEILRRKLTPKKGSASKPVWLYVMHVKDMNLTTTLLPTPIVVRDYYVPVAVIPVGSDTITKFGTYTKYVSSGVFVCKLLEYAEQSHFSSKDVSRRYRYVGDRYEAIQNDLKPQAAPVPEPVPLAAAPALAAAASGLASGPTDAMRRGFDLVSQKVAAAEERQRMAVAAAAAESNEAVKNAYIAAGEAWRALGANTDTTQDAILAEAARVAQDSAEKAKASAAPAAAAVAEAEAVAAAAKAAAAVAAPAPPALGVDVTADSSERLAKEKKAMTAAGKPQPGWDRFPLVTETRKSVLGIARESGRSWTTYERDTANGVIKLNTDWLRNNRNLEPEKKIAVGKEIDDHRATVTRQEELGLKGGKRRHKTPKRRRVGKARKSTFRRRRKH